MGIPILRLKDKDGNVVPVPAIQGADGKSAYEFALEGGYTGSKEEFSEQLATGAPGGGSGPGVSVKKYGAKGDGQTDDTAAFQSALAAERVVFVPGGTYILSGTLVIAENCCMELSQNTVLQFGQTTGNCIEMRGSATLRGNHAIISAPYAFSGSVIALDTALDGEDHNSIPPYLKAGSNMFKRQRFVYDVNIIKPDAAGFCRSDDGKCSGTAIYMSCEGTASIRWMWAITMSGIRIAGGFSYGIRAANFDDPDDYEDNAWNHDMRIEAVIEACEVGVSLENCNNAHLAVTVQPCAAIDGTLYAKWGFYLNDAKNADLGSCCVWDWANTSLWERGGEYQHIALIGQCRGLVLSDFLYYESGEDIRSLIYTDTASNLENMTIMQEPITRWFRPVDGEPYFYDGTTLRRLAMKSDLDEYFQTDRVAAYTDALASAIDTDGSVYNGIGYNRYGGALSSDGVTIIDNTAAWYGHTGYIPCKQGDTIYVKNILIAEDDGYTKAFLYDADFNFLGQNTTAGIIAGTAVGVFAGTAAEDGGTLTPVKANAAYMRLGFKATLMGADPIISVNEEIVFEQAGFLADGIKVKAENVVGAVSGGDGEWDYEKNIILEEAVTEIAVDTFDDGSPLALKSVEVISVTTNQSASNVNAVLYPDLDVAAAGGLILHNTSGGYASAGKYVYIFGRADIVDGRLYAEFAESINITRYVNYYAGVGGTCYKYRPAITYSTISNEIYPRLATKFTKIAIKVPAGAIEAGSTIKIRGVKA